MALSRRRFIMTSLVMIKAMCHDADCDADDAAAEDDVDDNAGDDVPGLNTTCEYHGYLL